MANNKKDVIMINPGYNRLAKTSNELGALIKKWTKEHTDNVLINSTKAAYALQFVVELKRIKKGVDG